MEMAYFFSMEQTRKYDALIDQKQFLFNFTWIQLSQLVYFLNCTLNLPQHLGVATLVDF